MTGEVTVKPVLKRKVQKRNVQMIRILSIIREMDRLDGVDLYELAQRHGTNVRTIRRDFEAIEAVGLPLAEEQDGRRKKWRIAFRDKLSKLSDLFDVSHYLALRVAMDGTVAKSSSLFATLEDLADKIEDQIGSAEREQLRAIGAAFYTYEKHTYRGTTPDVFWPLVGAIAACRFCKVVYRAPRVKSEDKEIKILPLRMFSYQQAVYLHAFVPKHGEVIALNLQRLRDLKVLEEKGKPPASYHPEHWEANAFGVFAGRNMVSYRLCFSPEIAPYIRERIWHPSQQLKELPDGGVELRFKCGESYEVTAWVASWRTAVAVVEPASLVAELAAYGSWLQGRYAASEK
jgi:predicted DNA-binding transcriptional regulator YafY